MRGRGEDGFSVLEAMIAVFLLAAAFLPLLELQGRFVGTVESLERAETRIALRQIAENHLATVNFALQPEGEARYGRTVVAWRATEAAPPRLARATGGAPLRFSVSLHDVEVRAFAAEAFTSRDTNATPRDRIAVGPNPGALPELRYTRRGLGWQAGRGWMDSL